MERKSRNSIQVQSVARAAEIIRCFRSSPELGISEIAQELRLNRSTVFGLVNTLVSYGYLEQNERNKKYRLGITLFELGNLVLSRIDIRNEARMVCEPLTHKYPATIHIATHREGEVIYIDKIYQDNAYFSISASSIGMRAPMHCTGVGKAMLAFLPREYLEKYIFSRPLRRMTPNTITRKAELLRELEEIRRSGVAVDRGEIEKDLTCIAVPVLNHTGTAEIAISASFPSGRIQEVDQNQVKEDLCLCTRGLSARLGYPGDRT